jgi:hypothetical protein
MNGTNSRGLAALLFVASTACAACNGQITDPMAGNGNGDDTPGDPGDPQDPGDPTTPIDPNLTVRLLPASGQSGTQVVNFAIPLPPGMLDDATAVRVSHDGTELPAYRRALATYDDGSVRSVQLQVELAISGETTLDIAIGQTGGGERAAVPVADTLVAADGTAGPKVWAILPADWMAASGIAGTIVPRGEIDGTPLDAWSRVCDYDRWNTDAFLAAQASRDVWLFDRVTAMYRGYAMTSDPAPLASGYREAAIYRSRLTGTGAATRIGVPTAADDLKYHYTQGMALHYLLTGDDRFRESAEDVAERAHALWRNPAYNGGFWTERHAGFGLLAYEWAAIVSDDQAATFAGWADEAVTAYLAVIDGYPAWTDQEARCFAHTADSHGEGYGTTGCSPWMSAILADALETHADRVGGDRAAAIRARLVKLGRLVAKHGRDPSGKPYYWIALGAASEVDDYDEHWGESAYLVAMAWHHGGRTDAELKRVADELLAGLKTKGQAGQLRSFNWQCRSAVQAPAYLK